MKKQIVLLAASAFLGTLNAQRVVRDQIVARVNGVNILQSDLELPRFNYDKFTLEQAIIQELYVQEAAKRQMLPRATDVDKYIASMKTQGGIVSDEEFEKQLRAVGFSLKRYKAEVGRTMAVNNVLSGIRDKVFVSKEDVQNYVDKHPEWEEESYVLKTTIVPFSQAKTEDDIEKITSFDWVETGWMSRSSLAPQMQFVTQLEKGDMGKPLRAEHGFQLVMLVDKRPPRQKTLDERYREVEETLRRSRLEKHEDEFQEELKAHAMIVFL